MKPPALLCALALAGCAHEDQAYHSDHLRHDFSDVDRWVKMFEEPGREAWQRPDEVVRLLGVAPGMAVADIGAGTGYFLQWLAPAVGPRGSVLALDIEPKLLDYMRARAQRQGWSQVQVRSIALDASDLATESLDRILIVNTWHHIEHREAYARQLLRALRPGGVVAIVDFTLKTDKGPPLQHRLSKQRVATELAAAGLAAVIADESLPDQYVVLGRRR